MAGPRTSADMYPPSPYRPDTYGRLYDDHQHASSSEYVGLHNNASTSNLTSNNPHASPSMTQHANDSTAFLNYDPHSSLGRSSTPGGAGAGGKYAYSDGYDGPPEAMLRAHGGSPTTNAMMVGMGAGGFAAGRKAAGGRRSAWTAPANRKYWFIAGGILVAVVVAAVAGGVVASHKSSSNSNGSGTGKNFLGSNVAATTSGSNSVAAIQNSALMGGNGSTITMENGTSFTYVNNFGGYWSSVPFDDSARAQEWVPALNETWDYTNNKIWGVNIGGWLVLEPFIVPGAFEPYENDSYPAVDEYSLMTILGNNASTWITNHYETFINEQDFAEIAGAGLSWVRIALPFWAIETVEGEPFVEGVAWKYFLKAITWARKYGLRINLDLHTMPGSQNGWNHSGKLGSINWLNSTNAIFNAERGLNYIRTLTEFVNQPQYRNVVQMFSIVNEPAVDTIGNQTIREFYLNAYYIIRNITGTGAGNGPFISFHDGFQGFPTWAGFLSGADRAAMDQHNYMAFSTPNNDSVSYDAAKPCAFWAKSFYNSQQDFGLSYSGEWALDINDCGVYLNNVGNGARYDGTYIAPGHTNATYAAIGSCDRWNNWQTWDDSLKQQYQQVAYGHMDALQNWFFWTWKIGTSTKTGYPPNPMWNMQLGLKQGYFPTDPRPANGTCKTYLAQQGFAALPANATFTAFPSPWMTGGAGAGNIAADQVAAYSTWPPQNIAVLGAAATALPVYTQTGTPITLSASTPTAYPSGATSTVGPGSGWADASDTAPAYTPISGCTYPLPYDGVSTAPPAARCTGA